MSDKALQRRIKQHIIAKDFEFLCVCPPGFEEITKNELAQIGITGTNVIKGGVEFSTDFYKAFTACNKVRTAVRILVRIAKFKALYFHDLHDKIYNLNWELYLKKNTVLSVSVKCHKSKLYHSDRVAQEVSKAVQKKLHNVESIDDSSENSQTIFIRFDDDICTVSLDIAGEPLYKRGWKPLINDAPIRENIAAGILIAADLKTHENIIDPMCGSGTFLLEALAITRDYNPLRNFAFQEFPCFINTRYKYNLKAAGIEQNILKVFGSDIDSKSVKITADNLKIIGNSNEISVKEQDFFNTARADYPDGKSLIVMNPPYGKRFPIDSTKKLFERILIKLNNDFKNCSYVIIMPEYIFRGMKIVYDKNLFFKNGDIDVCAIIKLSEGL